MATFFNQATLSFGGRLTNSNVTSGEILEGTEMTKSAISVSYGTDDAIAYAINIVNNGTTAMTGIIVTDNLGAYTVGANTVYPLEYVDGTVRVYINGVLSETAPTVVAGPPLVISGLSLPVGANMTILYEARTNEFASPAIGSSITNTASMTFDGNRLDPITATATVPAGAETNLSISKSASPTVVTDNSEITYTFVIQNTGNTAAEDTSDLVITDTFDPVLNPIAVSLNGTALVLGTDYTYNTATGEFATLPGRITVPAATYAQDIATGRVTVTPGVSVLTVTGTI